jgi:hypothetical protein
MRFRFDLFFDLLNCSSNLDQIEKFGSVKPFPEDFKLFADLLRVELLNIILDIVKKSHQRKSVGKLYLTFFKQRIQNLGRAHPQFESFCKMLSASLIAESDRFNVLHQLDFTHF